MVPVKLGMTEEELREELLLYYEEEKVEGMITAVKRNGFAAYGAFTVGKVIMPREEGREFNLLRVPGFIPKKRSEVNA